MTEHPRIAVLIPALNEELRIRDVASGALRFSGHVILVDDGSTDATLDRVTHLPLQVISHASRRGKGECLRTGFRAALALGVDGVVTMDGDGQHVAEDIPRLLAAARAYPQHIVIGARLRHRARQPTLRRLANELGDWGISWATGYRIADTQSGQRYYPRAVCELADVAGDGFVFEADILIQAARRLGTRCVSVPIESRYQGEGAVRQFRRSHFRPLADLYRIVSHVSMRIFGFGRVIPRYLQARRSSALLCDPGPIAPEESAQATNLANGTST